MKLSRHSNRLAVAADVGRTPRSNIEHRDRELRRSGASVERRSLPAFFQIAAFCRDAATGARFLASLVPSHPPSAIRNPQSALRAFTMVEIAISLAVVGFALVAIIGVLPRGLNAQRDNRTESTINLDAQYWMDALRNSARGADELTNYVKRVTVGSTTNRNGVDFTTGKEIIGLIIAGLTDPSSVIQVDSVAMSGSAVEKTGPDAELGFAYRMIVSITRANNFLISTNNAPVPGDMGRLAGNLYNVHLEFQWPLIIGTGHVGNGRQVYNGIVQAGQELDTDPRLLFFTR